ncbi:MAG: hypothetical protein GDA67_02370 [Nitrospira sp. CR1.3]|nr:hypothetical protein [Nitrospira sp. CR1.3]
MDVEIGSNLYRNTNGTIEIEGVPQVQIALKEPTKAVSVNFALFDQNGKMVAKMVDSTLMFNERRAYEVSRTATRLTLTHAESKNVVLQIDVKAADQIVFSKAGFHSIKGHLVEVSSKEWKVDRLQSSGTTQDAQGGAVRIG